MDKMNDYYSTLEEKKKKKKNKHYTQEKHILYNLPRTSSLNCTLSV